VLMLALLAFAGTVGPFALFAYGQSRVAPELAGAFLNLEPLVGALAGAAAFGDAFGPVQLAGGVVLLAGIALSAIPRPARRVPAAARARAVHHSTERIRVPAARAGHRRVLARRERPPSVRPRSGSPACSTRGTARGRRRPSARAARVR
jgi:EamA-like transporter family protein